MFWLVCPALNNFLARLERHGAVRRISEIHRANPHLLAAHEASHAVYERRCEELLSSEPGKWEFFHSHFVRPTEAERRRYGNAAVAQPQDVKCLHALCAAALGGAPNPVGCIAIEYTKYISEQLFKPDGEDAVKQPHLDDIETFARFMVQWEPKVWTEAPRVSGHELCRSAARVILALEGHAPRLRKKHRKN